MGLELELQGLCQVPKGGDVEIVMLLHFTLLAATAASNAYTRTFAANQPAMSFECAIRDLVGRCCIDDTEMSPNHQQADEHDGILIILDKIGQVSTESKQTISVATPAEPCGKKCFFLCRF